MDFKRRIDALREILAEDAVDAIVLEESTDIYYLTGVKLSEGTLLVHSEGAHLIVDGRYYETCQEQVKFLHVVLKEAEFLYHLLLNELKFVKSLGFCSEKTSYQRFLQLQEVAKKVVATQPERKLEVVPEEDFVLQLRSVKDPEEIKLLKAAADLGSKGFDYLLDLLKVGVTEVELSRELDIFWKRHGAEGVAFEPIIAFGPNTSKPHYRAGSFKLEKSMPVLIDIGVKLNGYHSDMTRVVFFGEPDPKMKEIYEIVQGAQEAALKLCKPGTRVGDLDKEARTWITDRGFGKEFNHSLGHGVGLQIHELPVVRSSSKFDSVVLQPGMVLTIEPGVYIGGVGGVRIEDSVVITDSGHINLTNRPKALLCIN